MNRRILIVGAAGMLGYSLLRRFADNPDLDVHASVRDAVPRPGFVIPPSANIHFSVDALAGLGLASLVQSLRPDEVINCVGVIKQIDSLAGPAVAIETNALLPHRLAEVCAQIDARLVHFSTDCVFDGRRGGYVEEDRADADDLYGRSKRLGEITYGRNLTLRTSLIGHELRQGVSLVDWFLAQTGSVRGFRGAVFSGYPTIEIASFLSKYLFPHPELTGLFHLASAPIDKFTLLRKIGAQYGHAVEIVPVDLPRIDRSLNGSRLAGVTGYRPPAWDELISAMHADYLEAYEAARAPR